MKTYPLCLIGLENQRSVVVGGGKVALRKVKGLLEAGANVTVISLEALEELQVMAASNQIELLIRAYQPGDLQNADLVVVATDDTIVNQDVCEEARQRRCLINVVDDPQRSNFILPAVVRRGDLSIAISTGGASPALARRLRENLELSIGPEYADYVAVLAELRPELLEIYPPGNERVEAALDLIDSDLLKIVRTHGKDAAKNYARQRLLDNQDKAS